MIKDKISIVPKSPGVYIFKGRKDNILYIGKAKNLRNRLRTYFQNHEGTDTRKSAMVKLIADFSYIITKNELEALVLEASLIKQYKPRFNVVLRDDKSYPYLKLTIRDEWPRIEVTRKVERDGSLFFGPYVPARSMWETLSFIRKNFMIRPCNYNLRKIERPCIQYQMRRCSGPCAGHIKREDYMKIVDEIRLLLSGKKTDLIDKLEKDMVLFASMLEFEEAVKIRDRIEALKNVWQPQRVISPELGDIDVIGFFSEECYAVFVLFFIRNGILIGTKDFYLREAAGLTPAELAHSFVEVFYSKEIIPPGEILISVMPEDGASLKKWLEAKRGRRVEIKTPKKGKRLEVLKMAYENAVQIMKDRKLSGHEEILTQLKEKLGLLYKPHSIGAFDISTTSGSESAGAFVYWSEGRFMHEMYRHLRIEGMRGPDDYAMMGETIKRVIGNLGDAAPDLILIDGGKGHLEVAMRVLETCSIRREDDRRPMLAAVAKDPDRVFLPTSEVIDIQDSSPVSLLIRKIRDEVHRFGLRYHRKLRDKKLLESPLMKIQGIGEKRRLELLRNFGSIEAVRNASVHEISELKGFNTKTAETVLKELKDSSTEQENT